MFSYSIVAYAVGFAALLFWILSTSNLIPEISIDRDPNLPWWIALLKNLGLVALFGLQHSIMARPKFKKWISSVIPAPVERSTFVLVSGLLLSFLVHQWEPIGGIIWQVPADSFGYITLYILFFIGWSILFISTFQINHFDLFGLRQTYFELTGKPYTPLHFRVKGFYKIVRHPLYFGGIVGLWATPNMSVTHLIFALALSMYFIIGTLFEEKDMEKEFGSQYNQYRKQTPMFVPFSK